MPSTPSEVPFKIKAKLPLAAIAHNFASSRATLVPQFARRFGISDDQAEDLFSNAVTKCVSKLDSGALDGIPAEVAAPFLKEGISLLWSVATRQRIDEIRSFNRRKTATLEPREDGETSEDQFGYTEDDPESRLLVMELGERIPCAMERAGGRKSNRQLLDALRECAAELLGEASEADVVCFTHAYLYDQCRDYQLPDREEISARLCEIMDKKRNALHVQVHRFKPDWEEARELVTAA